MSANRGALAPPSATPAQGGKRKIDYYVHGPDCACLDGCNEGIHCTEGFRNEAESRQPYNATIGTNWIGAPITASDYRFPQAEYFSRPNDRAPAAAPGVHAPCLDSNAARPLDASPASFFAPALSSSDEFGEGLSFGAPVESAMTSKSSNYSDTKEFDAEHKSLDDALRFVHGAPRNLCRPISVAEDDWMEVKGKVTRVAGSLFYALTSSAGPEQ